MHGQGRIDQGPGSRAREEVTNYGQRTGRSRFSRTPATRKGMGSLPMTDQVRTYAERCPPNALPNLGHGIGLRTEHYAAVLEGDPAVDWFEVITENFLVAGGNPRRVLRKVRERFPVVLHGVSMSLGSVDPLNEAYLAELAQLAQEIEPAWVSDHLCWGGFGGKYAHDLLPLPYTEEALAHFSERVLRVQDRLKRTLLIENVSSYVTYTHSTMREEEFLSALCTRAGCGLLLDINNIYVSAFNHGFDARAFVDGISKEHVGQFHLAGHSDFGTHLLDTHDHPVPDGVWSLYDYALARFGKVSTLIEWDDQIPTLDELVAESQKARAREAKLAR